MPNSPLLFGPNNVATNLQAGTLQADGGLLKYNGNKNYLSFGNFENNNVTGWSLGTVGTLTNAIPTGTPTFGSGAAGAAGSGCPSLVAPPVGDRRPKI